jgi:hypothetical protein
MIRLEEKIRLTPVDRLRWVKLTGFQVPDVRTLCELDAFIECCKRHYEGHGAETKMLHALFDRERERCLHGPDGSDGQHMSR